LGKDLGGEKPGKVDIAWLLLLLGHWRHKSLGLRPAWGEGSKGRVGVRQPAGKPGVETVGNQVCCGQLLLRHCCRLVQHGRVDMPGHVVVLEVDEWVCV